MSTFLPAQEIVTRIGASAGRSLSRAYASTFPCPLGQRAATTLRSVFYLTGGPPRARVIELPSHLIDVDGTDGRVTRFAPCTPAEVGAAPLHPLPGAGIDAPLPFDEYLRRRDRMYALAPTVWEAFSNADRRSATPSAREFLSLLRAITITQVSGYMVGASPEFFRWLREVTGQ